MLQINSQVAVKSPSFYVVFEDHVAAKTLQCFQDGLKQKPLSQDQLNQLMASLWPFYRETITGILSLTLRLTDEWMAVDQWEATAIAGYLLHAEIDEFGLRQMVADKAVTHHQLFLKTCQFFNVNKEILLNYDYVIPEATQYAQLSIDYYRNKSVAEGLGFHLASELTSYYEFNALLNGFLAHKDYYQIRDEKDSNIKFFYIHTLVEPEHSQNSFTVIDKYLAVFPEMRTKVQTGYESFMNMYHNYFSAINRTLF